MIKPGQEGGQGTGTVVGVNVALSGTLKDENDITVFGMVDGEIVSANSVTIGETAQVKGPIRGQIVTIAGVARGSIDASDKLEILATGKVYGSIATKDLVIHSGASFVGKSMMAGEQEPIEEPEPEPVEAKQEPAKGGSEQEAEKDHKDDLPAPEDE